LFDVGAIAEDDCIDVEFIVIVVVVGVVEVFDEKEETVVVEVVVGPGTVYDSAVLRELVPSVEPPNA